MPLQGNIESFGVSEILQLISQQAKTGTLEIQTGDGLARLRFLEGSLLEAWPDKRTPAEYIGVLLVRSGLITPAQLDHALGVQRRSLRRLGDILVRGGVLRVEDFQAVLALQHRETAYRLLRVRRGSFRFRPGSVEPEEGVSVPMDVGELLMEGFRQMDEMPKLLERVPSERWVYGRAPAPPEDPNLNFQERIVFHLVDGTLCVREVVDRARLGELAGWKALASLSEKGLIEPLGSSRRARIHPKVGRPSRVPDVLVALGLSMLGLGLLALFAGQGLQACRQLAGTLAEGRVEAVRAAERGRTWAERTLPRWPDGSLQGAPPEAREFPAPEP